MLRKRFEFNKQLTLQDFIRLKKTFVPNFRKLGS